MGDPKRKIKIYTALSHADKKSFGSSFTIAPAMACISCAARIAYMVIYYF
ncbi:hypothetical protein Q8A64_04925 [Oxalobacteraceae bacterium R-40]|uniref:Uncharacterized protein n=1 Tax=Keguizhuia sedimenti TaxID=3064264 RepID=A0ABU1BL90_9BURK|nr:hypothetical protein [Oxalobacteraceae bacterium R-40]